MEDFAPLTIKPVDGLLRLVLVVVPHEREATRISSPAGEQAGISILPKAPKQLQSQPPDLRRKLQWRPPAVARDEDVDDIAVAVEEREEVVGRSACSRGSLER